MADEVDNNLLELAGGESPEVSVPVSPSVGAESNDQIAAKFDEVSKNLENLNKNNELVKEHSTRIIDLSKKVHKNATDFEKFKDETVEKVHELEDAIQAKQDSKEQSPTVPEKTEENKEQQITEEKPKEKGDNKKPLLSDKLKSVVLSILPASLLKPKHKTTSKIDDDKIYNVTVKSFSAEANTQLINNLKAALEIKKEQEKVKTKSTLLKLAILAFVGMLVYLIFQIKSVQAAFAEWWTYTKEKFNNIKDSIMEFFTTIKESITANFVDPSLSFVEKIKNVYTTAVTALTNTMSSIGTEISNIVTSFKSVINAVKNVSIDSILQVIDSAWTGIKEWVNKTLGYEVFKIEPATPAADTEQNTTEGAKEADTGASVTSGGTSQSSSSPTTTQQKDNVNTTVNNINNTNTNNLSGDTNNLNIAGNKLSSNLQLQNGANIQLNKQDDVYIANKPDGVIHNIFKEISKNYGIVQNVFKTSFDSIITNIHAQDEQFKQLIEVLSMADNSSNTVTPVLLTKINEIEAKLNNTNNTPIIYTGVDRMRAQYRAILNG